MWVVYASVIFVTIKPTYFRHSDAPLIYKTGTVDELSNTLQVSKSQRTPPERYYSCKLPT